LAHWTAPKIFFELKAKDHIEFMDTNGDGGVDWQEFKSFMAPHVKAALDEGSLNGSMEEHLSSFKKLFTEADLNHDGMLMQDEMQFNLEDREKWMKMAAATGVIDMADDNKDGDISLNEVISNADKFGAKTEDFFEDQDLLTLDESERGKGVADEEQVEAFIQKSLRGGD
jgi:Ca2+-binding EF-hand superfamily protein